MKHLVHIEVQRRNYSNRDAQLLRNQINAYLAPSKPMFILEPPLNFKTTSLSRRFLVFSISAINIIIPQLYFRYAIYNAKSLEGT